MGGPVPTVPRTCRTETAQQGQALGMFDKERVAYKEETYFLQPEDKVFIYTDGLFECKNAEGQEYGFERLLAFLSNNRGLELDCIINDLLRNIFHFSKKTYSEDDVTILGFQYLG